VFRAILTYDVAVKILVIDVESSCWRGPPPPGEQSEIIEIGTCVLDTMTGEGTAPESLLVRPARSRISPFCTELTTLTSELVATGCEFHEACHRLRQVYDSPSLLWASYGEYDRKQFKWQCESFGVPYPFSDRHLNVKTLFARSYGLPKAVGMAGALKKLGLPLEGTHHRGGDDAGNIARILSASLTRVLGNDRSEASIERLARESHRESALDM
jgi:inhibitor of KinA sporulation pathway (predicted exonuclease)